MREEVVGETVQQDGVLVQAAVAARAATIVDARGVHVGALRVRRHRRPTPITAVTSVLMMVEPVIEIFRSRTCALKVINGSHAMQY